jgi:hypothetical protein
MRGAGLEPARYFYHEPLKLACLPFHHPRKPGSSIQRVGPVSKPGYYLGAAGAAGLLGAGAAALLDAGATGLEIGPAGAAGILEAGVGGSPNKGAAAFIGTEILRPSKILLLKRLVEEYARNSEVNANSAAKVQVSLKSGLLAPPAPNTV